VFTLVTPPPPPVEDITPAVIVIVELSGFTIPKVDVVASGSSETGTVPLTKSALLDKEVDKPIT
jgi:hypothetical protein